MDRLTVLKALLITQMNHWILFTAGITVLGIAGNDNMYIPQFMLLGFFPFLLFYLRCRTGRFLLFASLHISGSAAVALLLLVPLRDELVPVLVFSAYIVVYFLISLTLRLSKKSRLERSIHPAAALAILALMHTLQRYLGTKGTDHYYAVAFIVFIGLYYICSYLEHFQRFLTDSSDARGYVPELAIFKTGIRLIGLFSVLGVLLLFVISQNESLYGVFDRLFTKRADVVVPAPAAIPDPVIAGDMFFPAEPPFPIEVSSATADTRWLSVLFTVIACLSAAAIIYGLYKLFLSLRERFMLKYWGAVHSLDSEVDIREKIDVVKEKPEKRGLLNFLSPRERIRRIFKKRVLEGAGLFATIGSTQLLRAYTARECGHILNAAALANIYDKARYSDEECTPEDVKAARAR